MNFFIQQKFYLFMGPPGPNFNAINLTFSQIIGDIVVYNQLKFQIDNSQIDITQIFFSHKQYNDWPVPKGPWSLETGELQLAGTLETDESQIYDSLKTCQFPRYW